MFSRDIIPAILKLSLLKSNLSYRVKPVLRGHLWNRWPLMTGVCLIEVTSYADLTVLCKSNHQNNESHTFVTRPVSNKIFCIS